MDINQLKDNDYILYIAQDGNFQSRSILIPAKKFLSIPDMKKNYEIIKKCSIKDYKIKLDNVCITVDNLLIHNLIPSNEILGAFQFELTEYSTICVDLSRYADGVEYTIHPDDNIWYDDSIGGFCNGFNHIKNYNKFKKATKVKGKDVNIIDSFLVLETREGKFEISLFDTVDEMMKALY